MDIQQLQRHPESIRNVCIVAHVDHGKTTLSDHLISTNGVISKRLAGKIRYLDSRKDEQERNITMKASAISLIHDGDKLVNLVDSPGHVDFSSEVSAAVRVADGAIVLVDAVQGIGTQTQTVITQAYQEGLEMVLVINKFDRLIVDLCLSPLEAYVHLQRIIESVNAFLASLTAFSIHEKAKSHDVHVEFDESKEIVFSPELGNVAFASASDGWAFSLKEAAVFFSKKLGMKIDALEKALWGDFYFNPKTKTVSTKPHLSGKKSLASKPMFVQLVLENIWKVYQDIMIDKHTQKLKNIIQILDIKVPPRELTTKDFNSILQAVMSRWFPISDTILNLIFAKLPSPVSAQKVRMHRIWNILSQEVMDGPSNGPIAHVLQAVRNCDQSESAPLIAYISKMVALNSTPSEADSLTGSSSKGYVRTAYVRGKFSQDKVINKPIDVQINSNSEKSDFDSASTELQPSSELNSDSQTLSAQEKFIGFSRVFSGQLRSGQTAWVVLPPDNSGMERVISVPSGKIRTYLFMGKDLTPIDCVPAGNICAIGGVDDIVLNIATLSTEKSIPSLNPLQGHTHPILKVAVYPKRIGQDELRQLKRGLELLSHADGNIETYVDESGEYVIVACGELHIERCINDLQERFCPNLDIKVSEPIVSFRETLSYSNVGNSDKNDELTEEDVEFLPISSEFPVPDEAYSKKAIVAETSSRTVKFSIRSVPLPEAVVKYLEKNPSLLKLYSSSPDACDCVKKDLRELMRSSGLKPWSVDFDILAESITSLGPNYCGSNVLINLTDLSSDETAISSRDIDSSVVNGFQLAMKSGPLCGEPLHGVAFIIEKVEISSELNSDENHRDRFGPLSGQIISTIQDACRLSFMSNSAVRLSEAMFKVQLQCRTDFLGKLYGYLDRRRGKIYQENLRVGTDVFEIEAYLPVCESFGFAKEIRTKTRGAAHPLLVLSHWETMQDSPFIPNSNSRVIIDGIRKRKGLPVQEKVVIHAEKQRTLMK